MLDLGGGGGGLGGGGGWGGLMVMFVYIRYKRIITSFPQKGVLSFILEQIKWGYLIKCGMSLILASNTAELLWPQSAGVKMLFVPLNSDY